MLFNIFGDKDKPSLLIMHGMMNDWRVGYEKFHHLTSDFCLIFPAMDGCYDGSGDFTSFADQCQQIENYINEHFDGILDMVYGISQGATLMDELLSRNNITVKTAVLDGYRVASCL